MKKSLVAFCMITLSIMSQANALSNNENQHDPQQCPQGIDGYYEVSAASEINFRVSRDLNNNLVLQFIVSGALSGPPTIVHGRTVPVNSVEGDGTSHVIGQAVTFCQESAIYSKFMSNDESMIESHTSKMTLEPNGIQFQQISPTVSDVKFWPRID